MKDLITRLRNQIRGIDTSPTWIRRRISQIHPIAGEMEAHITLPNGPPVFLTVWCEVADNDQGYTADVALDTTSRNPARLIEWGWSISSMDLENPDAVMEALQAAIKLEHEWLIEFLDVEQAWHDVLAEQLGHYLRTGSNALLIELLKTARADHWD